MQGELLWISESFQPKDKRQQELDYAARKAHVATRAHRKRRQRKQASNNSNSNASRSLYKSDNVVPAIRHLENSSSSRRNQAQSGWTDGILSNVQNSDFGHSRLYMTSQFRRMSIGDFSTLRNRDFCISPWKGNSDPFDSQMIPVTPLLNKAVSFVRFYLSKNCSPSFTLQSMQDDTTDRAVFFSGSLAAGWLWDLFVSDNGMFWSAIASVLPIMKRLSPENERVALEKMSLTLKAESFACLRQKLQSTQEGFEASLSVMYHVKTLFREACVDGDIKGARYHARVLCWLAERLPASTEEVSIRRVALWSDATSALLQSRRPILPYSNWMPRMISSIWSSAESVLPNLDLVETSLSDCIISPPLRAAFLHVRQALYVGNVTTFGERSDSLKRAELIFQWMVTKAEHHICSLLNFYFNLNQQQREDGLSNGERYMEAALALAVLYILQKNFCDVTRSDGVDMHESATIIHPLLIDALQNAKKHCSTSEWTFYRTAHIWTLNVGAHCEKCPQISSQGQYHDVNTELLSSRWFHNELVNDMNGIGPEDTAKMKSIFSLFVMSESLMVSAIT